MDKLEAVANAATDRDADSLRSALADYKRDISTVPLLSQLLLEDWHDSHEDIVLELGLIGDPSSVEAILKASTIPFEHLIKWDNLHEFQRKCAYALARIGTQESRSALETLARSEDPYIRQYGEEGLSKWPLPFRQS